MINAVSGLPNTQSFSAATPQPMRPMSGAPKKKLSPKFILIGVVMAILVLGSLAVFSLSQQQQDVRQQASTGDNINTQGSQCSLSFTTTDEGTTAVRCEQSLYQDEFSNSAGKYSFTTKKTSFLPGDTVVFKVDVINTGTLEAGYKVQNQFGPILGGTPPGLTFMDSTCGTGAYNAANWALTCPTGKVGPGETAVTAFRIKLSAAAASRLTSQANIAESGTPVECSTFFDISGSTPTPTPTPSVTPTPTPTPTATPTTYVCGSNCTQDSQCPQNNVCSNGKCALKICTDGSSSCRTDKCSATGCNSSCTTNSECPNGHSCDSGLCPLTVCVNNSASCRADKCSTTTCGGACTSDSECPSGNICSSNKCVLKVCTDGSSACRTDKCSTTGCASSCSSNSECPNGYTCYSNYCRLDACLSGSTCTSDMCTVTYTPPATPAVGCNLPCVTNSDCQSSTHICTDTSSGRRCRLESNVNSSTCTVSGTTVVQQPGQPQLPAELPKSGSADILRAFFIGLLVVVLGVVGLLLL